MEKFTVVTVLLVLWYFRFPLFTKGKDRMQFTYGVFLLNKNIAQLRWLYNMHTQDLKLTLPNLLNFLQGYKESKQERFMLSLSDLPNNIEDASPQNILSAIRKLPPLCSFQDWNSKFDRKSDGPISETRNGNNRMDNGDAKKTQVVKADYLTLSELLMNKQASNVSFNNSLTENNGTSFGESNKI